jgi:hypothetical protein
MTDKRKTVRRASRVMTSKEARQRSTYIVSKRITSNATTKFTLVVLSTTKFSAKGRGGKKECRDSDFREQHDDLYSKRKRGGFREKVIWYIAGKIKRTRRRPVQLSAASILQGDSPLALLNAMITLTFKAFETGKLGCDVFRATHWSMS